MHPDNDPVVSVTPTEAPITELPALEDIDPNTQPLLYDFVAGCLDWHISIHRDTIDSDFYLLRHKSNPSLIWTDWYIIQGGYATPPLGSKIERIDLSRREADALNSAIKNIPEEYILDINGWQLVICAGEAARVLTANNIPLRTNYKYAEIPDPIFIQDGSGWPTDWLRREPYNSRLQESGISMDDEWWDTFTLRGVYQLHPIDNNPGNEGYSAICTGVREFTFVDKYGKVSQGMSWDSLRESCNALHCGIDGIYEYGSWEAAMHE